VNIFKEARIAYQDKKAELKHEHRLRVEARDAQRMLEDLNLRDEQAQAYDTGSIASSRRSRTTRRTKTARPALTEANLSQIDAASVTPSLSRRHTDMPMTRLPPPVRSNTLPADAEEIDMNLAYGELPLDLASPTQPEAELKNLMSRLDALMMEAQCVQHTATSIITSLQSNPEAMAAVALTLAEISNVLTKMSPGIITTLKSSSPAIFALLCSPQFLIAGGVAVGVTIVMFGGYKIIKKIQANVSAKKELDGKWRVWKESSSHLKQML
jgi:hypothetical protein